MMLLWIDEPGLAVHVATFDRWGPTGAWTALCSRGPAVHWTERGLVTAGDYFGRGRGRKVVLETYRPAVARMAAGRRLCGNCERVVERTAAELAALQAALSG